MVMGAPPLHALDQSALYRLTSKRRLAAVLQMPVRDLLFIAGLKENYREWDRKQKPQEILAGLAPPKKTRKIQQPKPVMHAVQRRLAQLLSRVRKPDFVYSATKGRSYFDNALEHQNPHPAIKIDIKEFYQSVSPRAVKDFFELELKCAPDVAHLLAQICCVRDSLPTGSALSPSLSYFACSPMFRRIAAVAESEGLRFTLYVDDMVFSGKGANRNFLKKIWPELSRNRLTGHKIAYFGPSVPKVITGAVVWPDKVGIPNSRQKRIRFFERAFQKATDPDEVKLLGTTLLGQYREGERLQPGSRARAKPVQERMDAVRAAQFADLTEVAIPKRRPKRKRIVLKRSKKAVESLRAGIAKLRAEVAAGVVSPPLP